MTPTQPCKENPDEKRSMVRSFRNGWRCGFIVFYDAAVLRNNRRSRRVIDARFARRHHHAGLSYGFYVDGHGGWLQLVRLSRHGGSNSLATDPRPYGFAYLLRHDQRRADCGTFVYFHGVPD